MNFPTRPPGGGICQLMSSSRGQKLNITLQSCIVCVCVGGQAKVHVYGGQRTSGKSLFSPCIMWVPGIKVR